MSDVDPRHRTLRWATGIVSVVLLMAIIAVWGCNDNSLIIAVGAILVILGRVSFEEIDDFVRGR